MTRQAQEKTMTATTYAEALNTTPKPIGPEGFTFVSFTPTVGLSARPRQIHILMCDEVEVNRSASLSSMRAVLTHAASVERFRAFAASQKSH